MRLTWEDKPLSNHVSVFIDGEEVTQHCKWADTSSGEALLLKRDAAGKTYVDPSSGGIAQEIVHGRVSIQLNRDASISSRIQFLGLRVIGRITHSVLRVGDANAGN